MLIDTVRSKRLIINGKDLEVIKWDFYRDPNGTIIYLNAKDDESDHVYEFNALIQLFSRSSTRSEWDKLITEISSVLQKLPMYINMGAWDPVISYYLDGHGWMLNDEEMLSTKLMTPMMKSIAGIK